MFSQLNLYLFLCLAVSLSFIFYLLKIVISKQTFNRGRKGTFFFFFFFFLLSSLKKYLIFDCKFLCCCVKAFSRYREQGLLFVAVCGLLIAEHRL